MHPFLWDAAAHFTLAEDEERPEEGKGVRARRLLCIK